MSFKRISYLEWSKQYMEKVKIDIARSNVKNVTIEELGIDAAKIDILAHDIETADKNLRKTIAGFYNVDEGRVFITNGASNAIFLLCGALINPGEEIFLESPNYEPLYRVASYFRGKVKIFDRLYENDFQINLEELERKISKRTKAIITTNLHNPTGVATNAEKLEAIGAIARDYGTAIISDEVYLDSALSKDVKPAVTCADNAISVGSLSKVYGTGNIRIGWIIAKEDVIQRLKEFTSYVLGAPNFSTMNIATEILKKKDYLRGRSRKLAIQNLRLLSDWIASRSDLRLVPPHEGSLMAFVKLPPQIDDKKLCNLLIEKYDTLVSAGHFFWLQGFIRISLGINSEILKKGLENVNKAIDKIKETY